MSLSLSDIHHLEAAEGWLERGQHANCFDELERIDYNNRGDAREMALRWKLYNADKQHVPAAQLALGIQWQFPSEPAGYVWRSMSFEKLGCFQDAYDNLLPVVNKFTESGIVPFLLATYACELGKLVETHAWLERAFEAPDAKELKAKALDEPRLETFWRKVGEIS
jgi:hypothetical protein